QRGEIRGGNGTRGASDMARLFPDFVASGGLTRGRWRAVSNEGAILGVQSGFESALAAGDYYLFNDPDANAFRLKRGLPTSNSDGDEVLTGPAAAVTDASASTVTPEIAHDLGAVYVDTEVEAALDALGTNVTDAVADLNAVKGQLNSLLAALRAAGIIAT
ncbi:MAG: hypothetical protein AAFU38_05775, partial [Bacteroidota bacterium]